MLQSRWLLVAGCVALGTWACSGKTERAPASDAQQGAEAAHPAASLGAAQARPGAPPARHLLLVVELEPAAQKARTLVARSVDLPIPRSRGPARPTRWRADVQDAAGKVLFSTPVDGSLETRGEFPDEHGELHGITVQRQKAAVTLRLPWLDGASQVVVWSREPAGDVELGRVPYPQGAP